MLTIQRALLPALFLLAYFCSTTVFAAAAKVVIVSGDVVAVDSNQNSRPLQRRSEVFEGDTLITGDNASLQLRFEDNAILALRANSQLHISEYHGASVTETERVLMELISGGFRTISGSFGKSERDAYQVRTPNASIGIRGTHYEAVFNVNTLTVGVYEGGVSVRNDLGELNLGLDSRFVFAEVEADNTPRGLLNPPDILNVPSTRLRAPNDAEQEADDASDDDETSDEDNNTDDAKTETSDTKPTVEPDVAVAGSDDLTVSTLENALNESAEQLRGDPRLTDAEERALANNSQAGFLVLATGALKDSANTDSESLINVMFTHSAAVRGENAFYGFFTDPDEEDAIPLDKVDPATDTMAGIIKTDGLTQTRLHQSTLSNGDVIEWGVWNASGSNPAQTYHTTTSGAQTGVIDKPFFYVLAEPSAAALTAGRSFSGSCDTGCFSSNLPAGTQFNGNLVVSLNQPTTLASGNLSFTEPSNNVWSLNYQGFVFGAQMAGFIGGQTSTYQVQQGGSYAVTGGVYGVFSGPDDDLVFAGGLNAEFDSDELTDNDAQTVTTDELNGVFLLEEDAGGPT